MISEQMIYLDYAATTPIDPQVLEAMEPYFDQFFGNPSSVHTFGQKAEAALDESREGIAQVISCEPKEVIFTSCGSESDNLAIRGVAFARRERNKSNHILTSAVEHHAVLRTVQHLVDHHGFEAEFLPVDEYGMVSTDDVTDRLRRDTALVSVIYANNEVGTINPIQEIGELCQKEGIPFHTDAVQAAAHLPVEVDKLNVDLMSIGAHKFYGPKGVGALYLRKGTPVLPMQTGGGQEFGMRAGTHNIPYIVGLAKAFKLAQSDREDRVNRYREFRDRIIAGVLESIPDSRLSGHPTRRLPNHASFIFRGVDGNTLLMMLDAAGYACSSGSACKTGDPEPSEVLLGMGIAREWALGSLRVTLGQGTTPANIEGFLQILPELVDKCRQLVLQ